MLGHRRAAAAASISANEDGRLVRDCRRVIFSMTQHATRRVITIGLRVDMRRTRAAVRRLTVQSPRRLATTTAAV
jgi:hypothetical protein